jgi:hypothetical protein
MSDGEEQEQLPETRDYTMFYISCGICAGVIVLILLYTYLKIILKIL